MSDNATEVKKVETPAAKPTEPAKQGASTQNTSSERRPPQRRQGGRKFQRRRKFCKFCADKTMTIDYKDPEQLSQFITERYKLLPSRVTGTCSKHQRRLTTAVKRARVLALLAFTPLHHD